MVDYVLKQIQNIPEKMQTRYRDMGDGTHAEVISSTSIISQVTGDISTKNSTTTVLGSDGVFTGAAEDVKNYKSIGINVFASHASATNGCKFQFSSDGVNWDKTHSFSVPAATAKFFNMPVEARYFRVVYTNGTTLQTAFRLQVIFHATMTKESTLRISENIDGETAAQLGRNILTGVTPDGIYKNILITTNQKLAVVAEDYTVSIAEGDLPGKEIIYKIGYNPAITVTEEDLWSNGGKYVFPTAEMGMEVVSSDNTQDIGTVIKGDATGNTVQSDADGTTTTLTDADVDFTAATAVAVGDCVILDPHGTTPEFGYVTGVAAHTLTLAGGFSESGTGASRYYAIIDKSAYTNAQAVGIHYLDGDFIQHEEIVVLNGTAVIPTVNTDIYRLNSFHLVAAGSNGVALGNITVRHLADTPVYGHISLGYTVARQAIFTVPADITGYLTSMNVSAASPNDVKVQSARIIIRTNTDPDHLFFTPNIFYPRGETVATNETVVERFTPPIKFAEKSDMIVSAQGFTGYVGPVVAVMRGYLTEDNGY